MKRILILGLVLVAMTASVSSQEMGRTYLGLKGSVSYMTFLGDSLENVEPMVGYAFGAFCQFNLHPRFALSPEIYYSVKGASNSEGDFDLKLGYIEIPLLLKLLFPTGSTVTPCVYGGGYVAFLMSAEIDEYDVKEQFADTDAGLIIGGSLDILVKEGRQLVNFDIRYSYGMTTLDAEGAVDLYNSGFQFLVGWGFSL